MTEVAPEEAAREHLLMNLRLVEGIDLAAFRARWNRAPDAARIAPLVGEGLLTFEDEKLVATPRGRLVLNSLITALAD